MEKNEELYGMFMKSERNVMLLLENVIENWLDGWSKEKAGG